MSGLSDFECLEEIGRGGETAVHRGHDFKLNREVAIKKLSDDVHADPRKRERFIQQAQFLAEFNHPHLVQVHSLESDQCWIVMELMHGSLEACVGDKRLSGNDGRLILKQCLEAIRYIHGRGKIHGLIRPSNVLFDGKERVAKLSDFESIDLDAGVRVRPGEAKYLAPELLNPGKFGEIGPRLDLYCLAFTVLEAMSGTEFAKKVAGIGAATEAETGWMRWHSSAEPYPPSSELVRGLPTDIADLLDRCLQKRVDDRPESADAALAMLDEHAAATSSPLTIVDSLPGNSPLAAKATPGSASAASTSQTPTTFREPESASGSSAPKRFSAATVATESATAGTHHANIGSTGNPEKKSFLSDKRILYPLVGGILGLAALGGLLLPTGRSGPPTGAVVVKTTPADAELLVDDQPLEPDKEQDGKRLYVIPIGERVITASLANHETITEAVEIQQGKKTDIEMTLPLRSGTIAFDFDSDQEFQVSIDGEPVDVDPETGEASLPFGKHSLEVSAPGFASLKREIEVGETNEPFPIDLEPLMATAKFSVVPPDAIVVWQEQEHEATNGTVELELPIGDREVTIRRDGCLEKTEPVYVEEDGDNTFTFELLVGVKVESNPAGVRIAKDGEAVEPDLMEDSVVYLPAGQHELTFTKDGFTPTTETVNATYEGENLVAVTLKRDTPLKTIEEIGENPQKAKEKEPEDKLIVVVSGISKQSGQVRVGEKAFPIDEGKTSIPRADLVTDSTQLTFLVDLEDESDFKNTRDASDVASKDSITLRRPLSDQDRARYKWLFARQAIRSGTADIAETQLSEAIKLDNTKYQFYRDRAIARATLGKTNIAKIDFKEAKSMPEGSQDFYLLQEYASLLFGLREDKACIETCNEALILREHATGPKVLLTQLAFLLGRLDVAFEKANRLWDDTVDQEQRAFVNLMKGKILRKRGDAASALNLHRDACARCPESAAPRVKSGLYEHRGLSAYSLALQATDVNKKNLLLQESINSFAVAMRIVPATESRILRFVAEAKAEMGQTEEGIALLTSLLNKYGPSKQVLKSRASLYRAAGMTSDAIRDEVRADDL